jgi:anti-sigma regulatory factor (Ser/Thr protein kinase)
MADGVCLELELDRDVRAPARARAEVSERLDELDLDGVNSQVLVLLVSEVVSNAVRHSSGPAESKIVLVATATDKAIRVAVTDRGKGFTPRPRDPNRLQDGYGLYLLEKTASSWGVESSDGTTVWFELDRTPSEEAAEGTG